MTDPGSTTRAGFSEPWQARIFAAATIAVEQAGLHWDDFRDQLKTAIARDPRRPYYESFMDALEAVLGVS